MVKETNQKQFDQAAFPSQHEHPVTRLVNSFHLYWGSIDSLGQYVKHISYNREKICKYLVPILKL